MKKIVSFSLALTTLLTTACAKKSSNSSDISEQPTQTGQSGQTAQNNSAIQTLYKETKINIGEIFLECISLQKCGDEYYFFYEDMSREMKLIKLDSNLTPSKPIALGKSLALGWGICADDSEPCGDTFSRTFVNRCTYVRNYPLFKTVTQVYAAPPPFFVNCLTSIVILQVNYIIHHNLLLTNPHKYCIMLFEALEASTCSYHLMGGVKVSTGILKHDKRAEPGVISLNCTTFKYKR